MITLFKLFEKNIDIIDIIKDSDFLDFWKSLKKKYKKVDIKKEYHQNCVYDIDNINKLLDFYQIGYSDICSEYGSGFSVADEDGVVIIDTTHDFEKFVETLDNIILKEYYLDKLNNDNYIEEFNDDKTDWYVLDFYDELSITKNNDLSYSLLLDGNIDLYTSNNKKDFDNLLKKMRTFTEEGLEDNDEIDIFRNMKKYKI